MRVKGQMVMVQKRLVLGLAVWGVATVTSLARADLMLGGFGGVPHAIERYSNVGVDLGTFAAINTEAITSMVTAPSGAIYTVNTTEGYGNVIGFNSGGFVMFSGPNNLQDHSSQEPGDITIGGNGNLLVPSTAFAPGGLTGILEISTSTGHLVGNLIPAVTPDAGEAYTGAAFNSSDNQLYLSSSNAITSYTYSSGDTYTLNAGFSIGVGGRIRFAANDPDVFVSTGQEIDQYDGTTGALKKVLVAPGVQGITGIQDFAVANGSLYVLADLTDKEGVLRFSATDGSFSGMAVSPFALTPLVQTLTYVAAPDDFAAAPEPGSLGILFAAGVMGLRRARKKHAEA